MLVKCLCYVHALHTVRIYIYVHIALLCMDEIYKKHVITNIQYNRYTCALQYVYANLKCAIIILKCLC